MLLYLIKIIALSTILFIINRVVLKLLLNDVSYGLLVNPQLATRNSKIHSTQNYSLLNISTCESVALYTVLIHMLKQINH